MTHQSATREVERPSVPLRPRTAAVVWALLMLCTATCVFGREKTDEITLANRSLIVGEIRGLQAGLLEVGTDDMGTVQIEWVAVASIRSRQIFEIGTSDGDNSTGRISPADGAGRCTIDGAQGSIELELVDIVRIKQLELQFWGRWHGHTDLGFAYGSANSQTDLTIDVAAKYTAEQFQFNNSVSGTLSDRNDAQRTSRGSLTSAYQRLLKRRWFWVATVDLARNEELDLELRASAIGEYGRFLRQTSRSQLAVAGGLSATRERYSDQSGEWAFELAFDGLYELYLFEGRETSVATRLTIFPSLTTSGRYRGEFSSSLRRKLVRDFTLSLTLEESYDSKPPGADSKKSDLRFRTTLGWSF